MSSDGPRGDLRTHRLSEYSPPAWQVPTIDLQFSLDYGETIVTSRLNVRRQTSSEVPLWLDGRDIELVSIKVDGRVPPAQTLSVTGEGLQLQGIAAEAELEIVTRLRPAANGSLMGLYVTSDVMITQCEPEGFRRITYFPDRPDVLSVFTVTLIDRSGRLPVLLSNGNPVAKGQNREGCRWVRWHDPHPKSCYLFAIAAGDLATRKARVEQGGRSIEVTLHAPCDLLDRGQLALETLTAAIAWDHEAYGRDYDLDVLNVVVVRDFEGAMENKGLIVTSPLLALFDPARSTDWDRMVIENNLAHEYFHNWTGNRVACRDWFQLGLKEGLTTFRHWQFSEQAGLPEMKRIWQVRLYAEQVFAEEAGPRAHAVRPQEYGDISNFYTATVYKKGAELPRMLRAALGPARFRAGMDRFFHRCDGRAVTFEDWIASMSEGAGADLAAYAGWYTQVGSPALSAEGRYDAEACEYRLTLTQGAVEANARASREPLPIPVAFGLVDERGRPLAFRLEGEASVSSRTRTAVVKSAVTELHLFEVGSRPVPSILRGFSAPVHLRPTLSASERRLLATADPDSVSRWWHLQEEWARLILASAAVSESPDYPAPLIEVAELFRITLQDPSLADLVRYELLLLPELVSLRERCPQIDMPSLDDAVRMARRNIAERCRTELLDCWKARPMTPYRTDPQSIGARRVRNLCLEYLVQHFPDEFAPATLAQLQDADNMSDSLAALEALCHADHPARGEALDWFARRWRDDAEVMDKWLQAQARSRRPEALSQVATLTAHPAFDYRNPGRVRALLRTFAMENVAAMHDPDGAGYRFLVEQQERLDRLGEKTAAWSHLLDEFALAPRLPKQPRVRMIAELERLLASPGITLATREKASRYLQAAVAAS